jgi:hypothetical protein
MNDERWKYNEIKRENKIVVPKELPSIDVVSDSIEIS